MLEPKRIETNVEPKVVERLGNNSYYYNYDINSKTVKIMNIDNTEKTEVRWNYVQVLLNGLPNYKECIRAIIRSYVTLDEEFDLINSSNSITLGVRTSSEDKLNYLNYLQLVQNIKSKVKKDFNVK